MCTSQRFTCHNLEADVCEDPPDRPPAHPGRMLPQPASSAGAVGTAGAAPSPGAAAAAAAGGLIISRVCGLKLAPMPAERSAIIPQMKRRLITLSTAGNLKISPLSNQQLHHHRIYPIRRPSMDGGTAAAAAAVPATAPDARDHGSQQSQPPPPPSTPSRHPHTPSSHLEGVRRELAFRDDNVPQNIYFHTPSSPEQPLPPLPPVTPRSGPRVSDTVVGGAGGGGLFATPRLVLRPMRPVEKRVYDSGNCGTQILVCDDGLMSGRQSPTHGMHDQQWSHDIIVVAASPIAATSADGVSDDGCSNCHVQMDVNAGSSRLAESCRSGPAFPQYRSLQSDPNHYDGGPHSQEQQKQKQQQHQNEQQKQKEHQRWQHNHVAVHLDGRGSRLPLLHEAELISGGDVSMTTMSGAVTAAVEVAAGAAEGRDSRGKQEAAAAAAVASTAPSMLTGSTIEVTVAVRPKAGAAQRNAARVGPEGLVHEVHNGYVQGPTCGVFDLSRYLTGRDCVRHSGRWISRSQFEKIGGSTMAKWYRSIRVLPDLEPLGEWLERHDMPVLRGPARRSRKRVAQDSDEEMCGWMGGDTVGAHLTWDADCSDPAAEAAEGGWDAPVAGIFPQSIFPPLPLVVDAWSNRMPLQRRDSCGGEDKPSQRLLSTWPLAPPLPRALMTSAAPSAPAAAIADQPPTAVATPRCFAEVYDTAHGGCLRPKRSQMLWPYVTDATMAPLGLTATATAVVGNASSNSTVSNSCTHVPSLQLGFTRLSSPLYKSQAWPSDAAQKLLPAAVASMGAGAADQQPPHTQQRTSPTLWRQLSEDAPAGGVTSGQSPLPLGAQTLTLHGPAPVVPRLLLHRTTSVEPGDIRGGGHPYLLAVQAPQCMLYRAGSGADGGGVP